MHLPICAPAGLVARPAPDPARLRSLTTRIDELLQQTGQELPIPALGDEIVGLHREINRLHALLYERVAAFDAVGGAHELVGTSTRSWLRHRTGLPASTASDIVRTARSLRDELPSTREAMNRGDLTSQHARTIAQTVRRAADNVTTEHATEVAQQVERVMLDVGRSVDAASLSGFGHRVRQIVDPDGALDDANRGHDRRWFTAAKTFNGLVSVEGLLDAEGGATVLTVLAAGSVPTGQEDTRSAGQRRADALVEMCRQAMDRGEVASTGGVDPHLLVTTSLQTLQAAAADRAQGIEPAELEWGGSIPPETARRVACDATISRVLVDPNGLPLDIGRSTRVISPAIRTALVVRDKGCVAECCDRPPSWTEAHHIEHWIDGGVTALTNLVLLCRTHHRRVHEEQWTLDRRDGRWSVRPP